MRKVQESLDLNLDGEKPLLLNCEGVFLPTGSGHRNPSVFSLFWRAWSSSFPPSLSSLTVDAVCIRGSTEPSGAQQSGTRRTEPEEGCCSPSCHPPLQLQSEEGTHSRCCLPAEVRVHKLRAARMHSHTSARALTQALDLAIKGAATG